jgi:glutathione S-transferase
MRLFDLRTGMNTRRVRIFLAEKNLQIPMVEVDMVGGENGRPEFLAMNPMGTMPILELDDGGFISESVAICRYVKPGAEYARHDPQGKGSNRDVESENEIGNNAADHDKLSAPFTFLAGTS